MPADLPHSEPPEEALVRRLVHLCLSAVAFAVLVGTAVIVTSLLGLGTLPSAANADGTANLDSSAGVLLVTGTFGGVAVAAVTAWVALSPLHNPYRQAMLATVAAFATMVAMLVAAPVHRLFGASGLLGLLALLVGAALLMGRRVARLSR